MFHLRSLFSDTTCHKLRLSGKAKKFEDSLVRLSTPTTRVERVFCLDGRRNQGPATGRKPCCDNPNTRVVSLPPGFTSRWSQFSPA